MLVVCLRACVLARLLGCMHTGVRPSCIPFLLPSCLPAFKFACLLGWLVCRALIKVGLNHFDLASSIGCFGDWLVLLACLLRLRVCLFACLFDGLLAGWLPVSDACGRVRDCVFVWLCVHSLAV